MRKIIFFILFIGVISCNKSNISHGTNVEDIDGFINFETYKPEKIEYELTKIGDDRLGPADYDLKAIAYFNPETFEKLKSDCQTDENVNQFFNSNTFMFEWLPQEIREELMTYEDVKSYTNTKLSTNPNCEVCFLNNKVLIHYSTN